MAPTQPATTTAPVDGRGRPAWAFGLGLALLVLAHIVLFALAALPFQAEPAGPDARTFLSDIKAPGGFQVNQSTPLDADTLADLELSAYQDLVRDGHLVSWSGSGGRELAVLIVRTGSSLSASSADQYLTLDLTATQPDVIDEPVDGVRVRHDVDRIRETVTAWSLSDVVAVVVESYPIGDASVAGQTPGDVVIGQLDRSMRAAGFDAPFVERPGYILGRLVSWAWALVGLLWLGRLLARLIRGRQGQRGRPVGATIDATPAARQLRLTGRAIAAVQFGALVAVIEAFLISLLWAAGIEGDRALGIPPIAAFMVLPAVIVVVGGGATLFFRLAEGRRRRQRLRSMAGRLAALGPALAGLIALTLGLLVVSLLAASNALGAEFFDRVPDRLGAVPSITSVALLGLSFGCLGVTVTVAALAFRWARLLQVRAAGRVAAELPAESALLLRSFRDDRARVVALAGARRGLVDAWSLRNSDRFEEVISWELSDRWPVVAVAEPGGATRALGAARVSLSDDRWRDVVWQEMHRCPCVVAILGDTPGFMWEVTALVRSGALNRTVFVFPPVPWPQRAHRLGIMHRALLDSMPPGTAPMMPADPTAAIALVIDAHYRVSTIAVDRWDEAGYRAALRAAFATLNQAAGTPAMLSTMD